MSNIAAWTATAMLLSGLSPWFTPDTIDAGPPPVGLVGPTTSDGPSTTAPVWLRGSNLRSDAQIGPSVNNVTSAVARGDVIAWGSAEKTSVVLKARVWDTEAIAGSWVDVGPAPAAIPASSSPGGSPMTPYLTSDRTVLLASSDGTTSTLISQAFTVSGNILTFTARSDVATGPGVISDVVGNDKTLVWRQATASTASIMTSTSTGTAWTTPATLCTGPADACSGLTSFDAPSGQLFAGYVDAGTVTLRTVAPDISQPMPIAPGSGGFAAVGSSAEARLLIADSSGVTLRTWPAGLPGFGVPTTLTTDSSAAQPRIGFQVAAWTAATGGNRQLWVREDHSDPAAVADGVTAAVTSMQVSGNRVEWTDAEGRVRTVSYDAAGPQATWGTLRRKGDVLTASASVQDSSALKSMDFKQWVTKYEFATGNESPAGAALTFASSATSQTGRVSFRGAPGRRVCAYARGTDVFGNVGEWSDPARADMGGSRNYHNCVLMPFDDRQLRRHGSWRPVKDKHAYQRTALLGRTGAAVSLKQSYCRPYVLARTGRSEGTIAVTFKGKTTRVALTRRPGWRTVWRSRGCSRRPTALTIKVLSGSATLDGVGFGSD